MISFLTRKNIYTNSKRNSIKGNNNHYHTNKKETTHILHKTQSNTDKKKLPFSHPNPPIPQKNSPKIHIFQPPPAALKTTFPKRKYIFLQTPLCFLSNVKELFLKRFGVFVQTLRHFGVKFSFSGRFSRIFFSRFIRIPVFRQEAPPLQAF